MKPLINKKFVLEKFQGKGGWTFVRLPELRKDIKASPRSIKVKGTIDGFVIRQYHLMPMGDGNLFLPVRAEIRKKIMKEAGDDVQVILYADKDVLEVPDELLSCLEDEPAALKFFNSLSESEKKYYVRWIYGAKKEETKISRLAKAVDRLAQGLKLYENSPGKDQR